MMKTVKSLFGMDWAGPVVRTAFQAGLAIVVTSGLDWYDGQVWRAAAISAGAAGLAKLQALSRD